MIANVAAATLPVSMHMGRAPGAKAVFQKISLFGYLPELAAQAMQFLIVRVDLTVAGKRAQAAIRVLSSPSMQLVCRDSQIGRHRCDRLRSFFAKANRFEFVLGSEALALTLYWFPGRFSCHEHSWACLRQAYLGVHQTGSSPNFLCNFKE